MISATATHSPTAQSLALAFSLKRLLFTATPSPLPTTATTPDSTSPTGTNSASGGSGVASQSLPTATPGHSATAAPQTSNAAINDNSIVAAASAADPGNVATAGKGITTAISLGNFLTEFLLGIGGVLGAIALYLALVYGWRRVWQRGSQQRKVFSGWKNPWLALKNLRQRSQSTSHLRTIILSHLWRTKGSLALAAAGVLGTTFSELLNPWPLKLIFDYVLLHKNLPDSFVFLERWFAGNSFWLLVALVAAYGLLTAISNGFSFLESYITSRVGLELVTTLRRELFVHLQRLSLSFHAQSRRGELLNQVSSDTQALREAFAEIGLTLVTNLLTIIGMCVVMFFINWRLSIIPLISVPTLFIVYYKMQQNLKETATKQRKTEGQIVAQLSENLAIMPVVQAFGRERDEVRRFDSANLQNLAKGVYLARLSATISRSISSISSLGLLAVVFYGAWLALNNQMTPGDVLLFVSYVKSMYKPIRDAVKLSSKLTKAYVSAQRIDEILSTKLDIEDKPDAIVARRLRGEIRFSHVNFGYDNNRQILHDLSFQIEQGERVAFVGASGAGKSTLTNLLLRLYEPQSGEISIDGLDIRDYMRDSLRHRIGLVLQEAFLMRGTIGENIAYGKLSATHAEIERAARQAHIHNFIMTLPNGYNTIIGELGNTLSGGQRQRIAIARALIKDPSILILDEPTSALDAESKQQVQETIEQLQRGKTILCIAHQLSTVENFDKIIVMDKGRIVEQGTHHELLQRQGAYARLHRLQHAPSTSNVQQGYLFPDALAVMT